MGTLDKTRRDEKTRRSPITREEGRQFRAGVIALLEEFDGTFCGTIRAFCNELGKRHGNERPFDTDTTDRAAQRRVESRVSQLANEGMLQFTWGKSQGYKVVTAIRLVKKAVEPPERRAPQKLDRRASAGEREHRQMELLALLVEHQGGFESIAALAAEATRRYGERHRVSTTRMDIRGLKARNSAATRTQRVRNKITRRVTITQLGRQVLKEFLGRGEDKALGTTPAPAAAEAPRQKKGSPLGEFSRVVLEAIGSSSDGMNMPRVYDLLINAEVVFPKKNEAAEEQRRRVRAACCSLVGGGYLQRLQPGAGRRPTVYGITERGRLLLKPPTPTEPAEDAGLTEPEPQPRGASTPMDVFPTEGDNAPAAELPSAIRAIDADIVDVERALDALADLEQRLVARAAERRRRLGCRLERLRQLRASAEAAYEPMADAAKPPA